MSTAEIQIAEVQSPERERVFDLFRHWGYLEAELNPFGGPVGDGYPDLKIGGSFAEEARRLYCGSIGAEFMHIPQRDRREWLQERMENPSPLSVDRLWLALRLLEADLF